MTKTVIGLATCKRNAIIQVMHYNKDFGNNLCGILKRLGCSRKDLADATGLSRASISRYCNSQRLPRSEGRSLRQLIDGIVILADKLQADDLDRETVEDLLRVTDKKDDFETIRNNFNLLTSELDVNYHKLAGYLNYDPSFLSRIRSGSRRPYDVEHFVNGVGEYAAERCANPAFRKKLCALIGIRGNKSINISEEVSKWLQSEK
ncbi:MAG: helix-turn-helix domain-containing protein [Erysipelotrichaceae bacterium]|nr:helix-turn-helix domain-containing protein [Erysipelotrichaceae bacterium]